jgi:hypothetical protein
MINTIGEATVQKAVREHPVAAVGDKEAVVQKAMQASVPRPVEKSNASRRSDMRQNDEDKPETTTRQRIEDNQVVLERYDRQGKLVKMTPPGYVPFGEIA